MRLAREQVERAKRVRNTSEVGTKTVLGTDSRDLFGLARHRFES